MARRSNYSARYPMHTTREVYDALFSRDYWDARVEEMRRHSPCQVASFHADDSGIELVIEHILPRNQLPEIAQTVMRKDMVITRKESYSSFGDEITGKYEAGIPAGPGSLTGTIKLFATDIGSTLRTSSEAKVYIPMIGPRLEQLMLVNLVDLFRGEAEFTQRWLDGNSKS